MVGVNLSSEISTWHNVVSVSVGNNGLAVGLKSDGTVNIMSDAEDKVRIVKGWQNVQQVECKFSDIVAILDDGTIVSTYKGQEVAGNIYSFLRFIF